MRPLLLLLSFLVTAPLLAQDAAPGWLEDSLYRGGKINAVVAVVAVIILGIGLWMFSMDRKLRRLEKEIKKPFDSAQGK